jgi:eukaryotic-like serine/threonine-protein kinase
LITRDLAGLVRRGEQRYAEAEGIHRQVLEAARRGPGPKHSTTLTAMYRLANVLGDEHRYADAETLERGATETMRTTLGESHPKTLAAMNHLAYILEHEGRNAEAEQLLRGVQTVFAKSQPNEWQRFNCQSLLGSSLAGQGRYQEAEPLLLDGYAAMAERRTRIPALDRSYLVRSGEAIVSLYRAWKQPGKAEVWTRKLAAEAK